MFERFTHAARAVVAHAHEETAALGHSRVGREHLLLGVAAAGALPASLGIDQAGLRAAVEAAPAGLDAQALATIGIDMGKVRRSVEQSLGPGALAARGGVAQGSGARNSALATKWTAAASRSVNERMCSQHASGPSGNSNSACSSSGATPSASR